MAGSDEVVRSPGRVARAAAPRRRRRRGASACLAAGVVVLTGCSSALSDAAAEPSTAGARMEQTQTLTADALVDALNSAGFEVPNPLDTTAQDCAVAGCRQSITTDTLRVESFATTASAQQYAAPRGLYQVEGIVVSFAPPLPAAEKERYRLEIQKLVE